MAKIMLVEDDNNLREIYEARLMAEGYVIVTARDGEEALAVAVKERPDLVISDVMMPKISGFDMLDILRSTPETKDVKVIMMTALSQVEDKERATKLGADRYLVKSQVTLEDVAKVAREVLEGTPAGAASSTMATAGTEPIADPVATASPQPAVTVPAEPATAPAESVATQQQSTQPAQAPVMDPVTMPATPSEPSATTDAPAPVPTPTVPASTDNGITDLSEPTAAPGSVPEPTDTTTPTAPQDNDIIKSSAEVWALDTPAPAADSTSTSEPAVKDEVATAEAKVESTDVQSLEDEEAAIAKQIESMIDTPAPAETPQPNEATQEVAADDPTETPPAVDTSAEPTPPQSTTEADTPVAEPATEPTTEPAAPATSAGQKVIQPINDPTKPTGPSIHELAAKEEANEAAHVGGSVISPTSETSNPSAPAAAEPPKAGGVDPNSLAL